MAYRIGDYQLDPLCRELRCGQTLRRLEPQVFDTLLFLVENRARVVSKDDLVAAVWKGRFVSDATVESRIKAARRSDVSRFGAASPWAWRAHSLAIIAANRSSLPEK